ncbi:MAG: hypothetical protein IIA48_09615 [Bacteroidetes bacterium]|nr:hypothetical protein [Bacteroidota bacterium]
MAGWLEFSENMIFKMKNPATAGFLLLHKLDEVRTYFIENPKCKLDYMDKIKALFFDK